MTTINAIPTEFNGITYRSRVEARWAVFFDRMGWSAVYEQEGFNLGSVRYLPDFWLPEWGVYVEIKAEDPSDEERLKCRSLAEASGKPVWLLAGSPGEGTYKVFLFGMLEPKPRYESWVDDETIEKLESQKTVLEDETIPRAFLSCRRCQRACLYYEYVDKYHHWGWREIGGGCQDYACGDKAPTYHNMIKVACEAARNERFGLHDMDRVNERVTMEEVCAIFKTSVPVEVLNLLHNPPSYMNAKMVRERIKQIASNTITPKCQ